MLAKAMSTLGFRLKAGMNRGTDALARMVYHLRSRSHEQAGTTEKRGKSEEGVRPDGTDSTWDAQCRNGRTSNPGILVAAPVQTVCHD
jgi:hypothetical protein